ncbi:RusA family crossover junction endodeoxyribonuclease [Vagococcus elongatus]|uniref:Uncharacterized protein n=1 Tax=Vagococcus elongatus TaxID=180344 RepID=A0A430AU49_9ENTE|nr:RusA family crossover junction endodeoxyribonuclease [Vagococcus elongatus]RSU11584.1 hypothetical protein CBF29_07845 [Vagococcus elongatus]
MIEFFMAMRPPTTTHQQKQVQVVYDHKKKKHVPVFYEDDKLKAARNKLMAHLGKYVPEEKMTGPLRVVVKWLFPRTGKRKNGEYKDTKPDLDNSNKLLQDCMENLGFYKNDAQIASLVVEKFWADKPGIYIKIEEVT